MKMVIYMGEKCESRWIADADQVEHDLTAEATFLPSNSFHNQTKGHILFLSFSFLFHYFNFHSQSIYIFRDIFVKDRLFVLIPSITFFDFLNIWLTTMRSLILCLQIEYMDCLGFVVRIIEHADI